MKASFATGGVQPSSTQTEGSDISMTQLYKSKVILW